MLHKNTTRILTTGGKKLLVGEEYFERTLTNANLYQTDKIDFESKLKIFGITILYKNQQIKKVEYKQVTYNIKNGDLMKANYTETNKYDEDKPVITIDVIVNYNLQITKLYYYKLVDLISALGGISAASRPLFNAITPMLMLYFFL